MGLNTSNPEPCLCQGHFGLVSFITSCAPERRCRSSQALALSSNYISKSRGRGKKRRDTSYPQPYTLRFPVSISCEPHTPELKSWELPAALGGYSSPRCRFSALPGPQLERDAIAETPACSKSFIYKDCLFQSVQSPKLSEIMPQSSQSIWLLRGSSLIPLARASGTKTDQNQELRCQRAD